MFFTNANEFSISFITKPIIKLRLHLFISHSSVLPCIAQNRSDEEANTFWVHDPMQRIISISTLNTSAPAHSFLNKEKLIIKVN